jgi:hypothetical protein
VATDAQTRANRLNSLKSTGPKTKQGKDASRFNATKHGLTAASADVLVDEDAAVFQEKADAYRRFYKPADVIEEELVGRMAINDLRSDRCRVLYFRLIGRHADRACLAWDLDRKAEAEELATRLPKDPGKVSAALEATRYGCEVMAERWEALGRIMEYAGAWDEAQRSMVLDLLGVHPALRVGRTAADAPEGADPIAFGVELAEAEASRLRDLKAERLDAWDETERSLAEQSFGAELTREMMLLHRYETQIHRRFDAARRHFLKRDRGGSADDTGTASATPPAVQAGNGNAACLTRVPLAVPVPKVAPAEPEPATPTPTPSADRPLTKRQRRLLSKRLREAGRR